MESTLRQVSYQESLPDELDSLEAEQAISSNLARPLPVASSSGDPQSPSHRPSQI